MRWQRMGLAAGALGAVLTTVLPAQICRGMAPTTRGAVALAYGRAAERAEMFGADAAWRSSRGLLLFADGRRTAYPSPDPARDRIGLGLGMEVLDAAHLGVCPTVAVEAGRIEDLRLQRYPIGVALGWWMPLQRPDHSIGATIEPFYVHQREQIDRFVHRSDFVSGRVGVVFAMRRLLTGLVFEHAFDADARWNARARVGFTY